MPAWKVILAMVGIFISLLIIRWDKQDRQDKRQQREEAVHDAQIEHRATHIFNGRN